MKYLFYILSFLILSFALKTCQFDSLSLIPRNVHINKTVNFDIYISDQFNANDVELINEATREWEEKTDHLITYHIYYNFDLSNVSDIRYRSHSLVFIKLSKYDKITQQIDKDHGGKVLGLFDGTGMVPRIFLMSDRLLGAEYERSVILHELGHFEGLTHSEIENTLMYPSQDKSSKHITKDDLKAFCKKWRCSANVLK